MTDPQTLRRTGLWQVLVLDPPAGMDPLGVVGIALVVDVRANRIRGASPLTDLAELADVVLQAAMDPPGDCKPARPRSLQCQPRHASALAEAGRRLGCSVHQTRTLKAAEAAAEHLADYLSPEMVGMPRTDAPWRELVAGVFADPPWATLDDGVEFHFRSEHAELDGRVLLVLGLAGQQLGYSIFPDVEALDRFREGVGRGPGAMALDHLEALLVHFDPPERLQGALVRAARRAGLVQREADQAEQVLNLVALEGGTLRPMTAEEESTAAGMVEATQQMWRRHRDALLVGGVVAGITLADGRMVEVAVHHRSEPAHDFDAVDPFDDNGVVPLLDLFEHLAIFDARPGIVPTIVFKYAKAHARKVAAWLEGLERLRVVAAPDGLVCVFVEGAEHREEPLWIREAGHPIAKLLVRHPEVTLIVSSGGAKRQSFHRKNIVFEARVAVDRVGWPGGGEGSGPDGDDFDFESLDPNGLLAGKDWSGPVGTWPAASATLMAFGNPLELDGAPLEIAEAMYKLLTLVWNAVVTADFQGRTEKVDFVRSLALPLPIPDAIERLITRKRRCFPQDNRIMKVAEVTRSAGVLRVGVEWTVISTET